MNCAQPQYGFPRPAFGAPEQAAGDRNGASSFPRWVGKFCAVRSGGEIVGERDKGPFALVVRFGRHWVGRTVDRSLCPTFLPAVAIGV